MKITAARAAVDLATRNHGDKPEHRRQSDLPRPYPVKLPAAGVEAFGGHTTFVTVTVVTMVGGTLALAARQHRDALRRDLKPIYTAPTAAAAEAALEHLAEIWGGRYPP